jgi:hypothetical protein
MQDFIQFLLASDDGKTSNVRNNVAQDNPVQENLVRQVQDTKEPENPPTYADRNVSQVHQMPVLPCQFVNSAENHLTHGYGKKTANMNVEPHGQNATMEDNPHTHVKDTIKQGSDVQGQFTNKQEKPSSYIHDVITPYHSWAQVQQRPTDKQNPPFPKGHHTVAAGQNVAQAQPKPTSSQFINEVEIDRLVEEVAKRLQHSPNKSKNDANPSGGIHAAKRYFFIYCEITFCITTPGKGM